MKKTLVLGIALVLMVLIGWQNGRSAAQVQDEVIDINGTAYWATEPTGPDFQGRTLIPFQAQNPSWAAWEETQEQNLRYLDPDALPQNIQVSHSGWITDAITFCQRFQRR